APAADQVVPPAGWNPVTGTDDELRDYGFPPRPSAAADLAAWTTRYNSWLGAAAPGVCISSEQAAPQTSGNWGGIVDYPPSGAPFTAAGALTTMPKIGQCPSNAYSNGAWSGIGGWPASAG